MWRGWATEENAGRLARARDRTRRGVSACCETMMHVWGDRNVGCGARARREECQFENTWHLVGGRWGAGCSRLRLRAPRLEVTSPVVGFGYRAFYLPGSIRFARSPMGKKRSHDESHSRTARMRWAAQLKHMNSTRKGAEGGRGEEKKRASAAHALQQIMPGGATLFARSHPQAQDGARCDLRLRTSRAGEL